MAVSSISSASAPNLVDTNDRAFFRLLGSDNISIKGIMVIDRSVGERVGDVWRFGANEGGGGRTIARNPVRISVATNNSYMIDGVAVSVLIFSKALRNGFL